MSPWIHQFDFPPFTNSRDVEVFAAQVMQRCVSHAVSTSTRLLMREPFDQAAIVTSLVTQMLGSQVVRETETVPETWWDAVLDRWLPMSWKRSRRGPAWLRPNYRTIVTQHHTYVCPHLDFPKGRTMRWHLDHLRFGPPSLERDRVRHRLWSRAVIAPSARFHVVSGDPSPSEPSTFDGLLDEVMGLLEEERAAALAQPPPPSL